MVSVMFTTFSSFMFQGMGAFSVKFAAFTATITAGSAPAVAATTAAITASPTTAGPRQDSAIHSAAISLDRRIPCRTTGQTIRRHLRPHHRGIQARRWLRVPLLPPHRLRLRHHRQIQERQRNVTRVHRRTGTASYA